MSRADELRERLAKTQAARRDAVQRAARAGERDLPAYSEADDQISEVTARVAALSAEAAAGAVAKVWRESQHDAECEAEPASAKAVSLFRQHGKTAGAIAVGATGFAALIKAIWKWF